MQTAQRDPRESPDEVFRYVDISSIDRDQKRILSAVEIIGADAPSRARKEIRAGDVLVSTVRPNLNTVAIVPEQLDGHIASTGFCVLRPKEPTVLGRFLFYYCRSRSFVDALVGKVRGAQYPAVSDTDVKAVEIPLPPPSEQRHIVKILDQADRLRGLRAEADAKAELVIPALFIKMFGDPTANPKGWRELPLDRLADVQGGLQLSEKRKGNIDVPYLRVANVYRNRLDLSEIKTLSVTQSELDRTRLTSGDVLVVEGHGNPAEIGRCAVWDGTIDPCVHQNHLIRARPDPSQAKPYFLSAFLNSTAGRQHLLRCGKTTSGLNTITVSNVKDTVVFLPPVELQQQFEEAVAREAATRKLRSLALATLERFWKLLLDRAFSGSLTVKWREAHMKELLQEMEQQSRLLSEVN